MDSIVLFISFLVLFSLVALRLILAKWTAVSRGFTQLGLFLLSEIAFLCGKGVPCSNCPLSFGACPVGSMQRLAFMPHWPIYLTLGGIAFIGLLLGTLTCGWACPLGFLQDLINSICGKEIKPSNKFKALRYLVLLAAIALLFLELRFQYFSRRGIGVFNEPLIIGGGLILGFGFFIRRPFCRFLCPLGLVYGKLNALSPLKIKLKPCSGCAKCPELCVTGLNPVHEVNGDLCVKCFNCKKVCGVAFDERDH